VLKQLIECTLIQLQFIIVEKVKELFDEDEWIVKTKGFFPWWLMTSLCV
jgi:hypothetical protein